MLAWKIVNYKNRQIIYDEIFLIFLLLSIFATNPWKNWEPEAKVVFVYLNGGCKVHSWEIGLEERGANHRERYLEQQQTDKIETEVRCR